LGAAGLWLFSRAAPAALNARLGALKAASITSNEPVGAGGPQPEPVSEPFAPETSSRIGRVWPLAAAFLIFLVLAGLEFIAGRYPQVLAVGQLEFAPVNWQAPSTWSYELRNILDEPVGTAECSLAPEGSVYQLDCQIHQQAFEARQGNSFYKTGAYELQHTARWQRDSLQLLSAEGKQDGIPGGIQWSLTPSPSDGLVLVVNTGDRHYDALPLPNMGTLLEHEWPWRLQALPFNLSYSRRVTLASPLRWSEVDQESIPLAEDGFVFVAGSEPLGTPVGNFIAWRVELGDETAWYDSAAPYTLLRYDNGMVSFILREVR
jgi:hypothetical protein